MKSLLVLLVLAASCGFAQNRGQDLDTLQRGDSQGDGATRSALARAAQRSPADVKALSEYAEYLDRYGDPDAREAYSSLLAALRRSGDPARAAATAKRLLILDLLAGDAQAASRRASEYRDISGRTLNLPPEGAAETQPMVLIPGPVRAFARMAALSPDTAPEDILSALARNVVTNGYQASHSADSLEPTEYLKLVRRYLSQAREIEKLAGPDKILKIENCEAPNAGDLLRIMGFRMRGGCGSEVVLETVNASRAFLTTDSGFPVNDLEQALRTNRPFTLDFRPTQVPVLFGPDYWLNGVKLKDGEDFIEAFVADPSMCRLYLGLVKLDRQTAEELRKTVATPRLKAFAHVLDFFGGMFEIRNGKATVPGGQRAAPGWSELVGVSPDRGAAFIDRLVAKDDGWLASMFDALARIHGPVQDYLTEPAHLKRFYAAIRGRISSPGPARPVFRSNTDMMLLTTRLQIDPNGKPHVPGSLEIWKNLFIDPPRNKYDQKLTRAAPGWKDGDDVLEAIFALCRKAVDNEPLKIFMTLSDLDRSRTRPLEAATVDRLARDFRIYSAQYPIFTESPTLSDKSIVQYLDTADFVTKIKDPALKADTAGTMQALVGLWQIFVRLRTLPDSQADAVFASIVAPFGGVKNNRDVFAAGQNGVKALLSATGEPNPVRPQERLVDLIAGAADPGDKESHTQVVQNMSRILEAQRIVSLDSLWEFSDYLDKLARGEKANPALVNRLASRVAEIQAPRQALTAAERNSMGFGYWTDRHVDTERKLNLRAAVDKAAGDPEKLKELRGLLTPLLRDTLVAYNYAHYAPPGAQILYTNPMFVRSHDFLGIAAANHTWRHTEPYGSGWPFNAGGRLVGSLSGLPYALADAEQNFLIPLRTQALIWGDLAPQMMLSAKIPRWWNVTPAQVHWVGLHLRYGRSLLAEAVFDSDLRTSVLEGIAVMAPPARTAEIGRLIAAGRVKDAVEKTTPSELFLLARDMASKRQSDVPPELAELRALERQAPAEVTDAAISRAFGTPKPTLASTYAPQLLNLRTFPALMGYSSRIMAESWESNTLYWAGLADETGTTPSQLNLRIPEWTEKLVERIFASHLEDWPALLKSLRAVGEDVRARSRAAVASGQTASVQEFFNPAAVGPATQ